MTQFFWIVIKTCGNASDIQNAVEGNGNRWAHGILHRNSGCAQGPRGGQRGDLGKRTMLSRMYYDGDVGGILLPHTELAHDVRCEETPDMFF